jgi:hypothetical protein
MSFLLVLHGQKQIIEGLFSKFKNIAHFEIVVRTGISVQKNFGFFLGATFVLRRAKFCCIIVLLQLRTYYKSGNAYCNPKTWC